MKTIDSGQARQGGRGRRVLVILLAAMVLAGASALALDLFDRDPVSADIGEPGV
ncbi:MAG: hypothetical protein JJ926_13170 [Roseitalea sp.]|jgi:hypothetical protein|uniref:hypothetical protein n=1 Tax=Oceaniradius stylonematis TaxID=2184161 RepID=UPI001314E29A|nr:hypothetical protein [Oceaniradius stylonematis]MBO6554263.1 hypothetical protein [Roseitalea sp.]MBO6953307.1 hypothetical protein [Rhizobiaceae bacterium]MBO6593654.1 hypothetical protein [Roseitalea sp.]MBO6601050.1 hypothetical protein [Roseitalea sp.]MBO6612731.1 hypothetical protein [Roseitalea sp.]